MALIFFIYFGDFKSTDFKSTIESKDTIILKHNSSKQINKKKNNVKLPEMRQGRNFRIAERYILLWNDIMDMTDTKLINPFFSCKINNCIIHWSRNAAVHLYHAVVFNAATLDPSDLPDIRTTYQRYILYSSISPYEIELPKELNSDFFNFTMTYRSDSDIFSPYRIVEKRYKETKSVQLQNMTEKKLIATFDSYVDNKRHEKLVKKLQKYLNIYVYEQDVLPTYLEKNYKFFMVFEKYDCEEYVTKPLYDILNLNIVPIVFGFNDFGNLPPNSVINAVNFKNPEDLVEYLKYLDSNLTAYAQYFEWKRKYIINDGDFSSLCRLCERVNCLPINRKSYENVLDWFYGLHCYG